MYHHGSLSHQYLVGMLNYDANFSEMFGAEHEGAVIYFDYFETSLKTIIESRRQGNQRFQIKEIMKIGEEAM